MINKGYDAKLSTWGQKSRIDCVVINALKDRAPPHLWPFSDPYHSPQTPEEVAEHLAGGGIDDLYDLTKS